MTVDYSVWRFWLDAGNYVATIAIGLYVWWDKRKIQTAKRFRAIEQWQAERGTRLETVEKAVKTTDNLCNVRHAQIESLDKRHLQLAADYRSLPTRADLGKISEQVNTIGENLGRMDGRLTGIGRAVDLMNQHLLKGER